MKRQEAEKALTRKSLYFGMVDFYDGLVYLAMARKSNDIKWKLEAGRALSKLELFVKTGKDNCEHKLLLLQAETNSLMEENDDAFSYYESAIIVAGKNGYIHEQAIANERAGDFSLQKGDPRAS
eukprot:1421650-Ditylum_brightwellii.AAC.1